MDLSAFLLQIRVAKVKLMTFEFLKFSVFSCNVSGILAQSQDNFQISIQLSFNFPSFKGCQNFKIDDFAIALVQVIFKVPVIKNCNHLVQLKESFSRNWK